MRDVQRKEEKEAWKIHSSCASLGTYGISPSWRRLASRVHPPGARESRGTLLSSRFLIVEGGLNVDPPPGPPGLCGAKGTSEVRLQSDWTPPETRQKCWARLRRKPVSNSSKAASTFTTYAHFRAMPTNNHTDSPSHRETEGWLVLPSRSCPMNRTPSTTRKLPIQRAWPPSWWVGPTSFPLSMICRDNINIFSYSPRRVY
jgi:hypothetical protein